MNYTVSVYENSPVGTPLVNVTATDLDSGQNARITYTVTGGDPFSVFTVDTQVSLYMLHLERNQKQKRSPWFITKLKKEQDNLVLSTGLIV